MRKYLVLVVLFYASYSFAWQVTTPPTPVLRDQNAKTILTAAIAALGGNVPEDLVVQGIAQLDTGESATITLKTLGLTATSELISTSVGDERIIYSGNEANLVTASTVQSSSAELAASSRSPMFLLPELVVALQNTDVSLAYLGKEGSSFHIRIRNTFASRPRLTRLADFTQRDIWFDASMGLPTRISFVHRRAEGAVPSVAEELDFANYQAVGNVNVPFTITRYINGVLWGTISVQKVQLNNGLTPADFPIQ